jgi:hypothetical protein
MTLEIVRDIDQGTDAWRKIRAGIPTASEFSSVLAKGEGKVRRAYMLRLAGEILTGEPAETYESAEMVRGREMERTALETYAFTQDCTLDRVAFVRNGPKGCSPDALVDINGMAEAKSNKPSVLIEHILRDKFPASHVAQCQGALWVAEREWIDIVLYWPAMPVFVKRAYRDEPYIATLAEEVDRFNAELHEMVEKVLAYGRAA